MARSSGKIRAGSILKDRERIVHADPLERREILRLTERFAELKRQLFRNAVDTAIELGEILREGRRLAGNRFREWTRRLGITYATARNYESLATLAEVQPRLIQRFKELGPTKLYRLAVLDEKGRKHVLGAKKPKALIAMNQEEFAAYTKPYIRRQRTVTPDMLAHGLRMKVRAWTKTLADARIKGIRSEALRTGLKKELEALAKLGLKVAKGM
ncbi:MAG: hypothetical protein ACYTHM_09890 [Planctomycetota bacterium]|jgi:hypothetical protein